VRRDFVPVRGEGGWPASSAETYNTYNTYYTYCTATSLTRRRGDAVFGEIYPELAWGRWVHAEVVLVCQMGLHVRRSAWTCASFAERYTGSSFADYRIDLALLHILSGPSRPEMSTT